MRIVNLLILPGLLVVAGCSIHPLPDDVTRASTVDIITKIRCEAQQAIWAHAHQWKSAWHSKYAAKGKSEKTLVSDEIRNNPNIYDPILKFRRAAIAYEFQFTINEDNDASGRANFRLPFTNGRFSLGTSLGSEKQRRSDRNIKFADSFEETIAADCRGQELRKKWRYPISGRIGLDEFIKTFLTLERLPKLQGQKIAATDRNKLTTFYDKLTFTTLFRSSVNPSVTLNPGPLKNFRLADASVNLDASRRDVHSVRVVLTLDTPKGKPRALPGLVPESSFMGPAATIYRTPKERALFELDRQRLLENDERILDILR